MGIINRFFGMFGGATVTRIRGTQDSMPGYYQTKSAVPVTVDSAMQLSAVWACCKLISECIGSMSLRVYQVDPTTGERKLLENHPLMRLFDSTVNMWQTRQEYFESIVYQNVLLGNDYSLIQRNSRGEIIGLVPLMAPQMTVTLNADNSVKYEYRDANGEIKTYSKREIWHNKLFGNGIVGLSPLAYARNSIGIAQAADDATTEIYRDGGRPSGVIEVNGILKEGQRDKVRENVLQGLSNEDRRLLVLGQGMTFKQVSMTPEDIELLSSRRFQIEDICRFFGVPSVLVNDTKAATTWGSGIEQIVQGFYKLGLRPYIERYESSIRNRLIEPEDRKNIEIEFDINDLLMPGIADRVKTAKEAVTGALMTPNEGRAFVNGLIAKPGADSLIVQQQMIPLENIGELNRGTGNGNQE